MKEHIRQQIVTNVNIRIFQPLPSEVFEQINYNIEEDDADEIYAYIVEEIASRSFEYKQELNDDDYKTLLTTLGIRTQQYKRMKMPRRIIGDLERLLEKVEIIRGNHIEQ